MAGFRPKNLVAALFAAAFGGPFDVGRMFPTRDRTNRRRPRWHKPHQGARECARRIGGETWAMHKAGDRARRGLQP